MLKYKADEKKKIPFRHFDSMEKISDFWKPLESQLSDKLGPGEENRDETENEHDTCQNEIHPLYMRMTLVASSFSILSIKFCTRPAAVRL